MCVLPRLVTEMPVLHANVSDHIKTGWKSLARNSGQSESELLRQVVVMILTRNGWTESDSSASSGIEPAPKEGSRGRAGSIRLELKAHELAAIERAAARLGWKRNTWLIGQIRAQLFREPRTTEQERAALMKSTAELRAIGRNLNQIARALHKGGAEADRLSLERLERLHGIICRHADRVSGLLQAAEHRWAPSEGDASEAGDGTAEKRS